MKKHLLSALAVALLLGSQQHAAAQARKPAPKPAATRSGAAATAKPTAAVDLVDLDLTSSGIPLTLKVPRGTKVEVHPDYFMSIALSGPNFALSVGRKGEDSPEEPSAMTAVYKDGLKAYQQGHDQLVVDTPLAYRARTKKAGVDDKFCVVVPDTAAGTYYLITQGIKEEDYTPFGRVAMDRMWAAAQSAQLSVK